LLQNLTERPPWQKFSFFIIPLTVISRQWRTRSPKARARPARPSTSYYKLDQVAPVAKVEELANYDAIIVGTGTRFGRMSSQMANFLDQAGGLWAKGALHGKVGGAFASTASQHGGQETTLFSIITNLLHFGMTIIGLNYGFSGQLELNDVTGGSPYGATTIAGGDGSRQPTENELAGARYQGRVIAETAKKLHG
jgi:NAD(P)H dehydrogenase (quinone)